MLIILSDMVKVCLEVFMDDFTVYWDFFDKCLGNLKNVLEWCEEKNLILNGEKWHFMVTKVLFLALLSQSDGI